MIEQITITKIFEKFVKKRTMTNTRTAAEGEIDIANQSKDYNYNMRGYLIKKIKIKDDNRIMEATKDTR